MSLFARRSAPSEQRAVTSVPWNTGGGDSLLDPVGRDVEASMSRFTAIYAAHRYIIDQFVSVPFHAYRVTSNGTKYRDPKQPAILTDPHPFGAYPFVWYTQMMASLLSEGNAYGIETSYDSRGQVTKILWLNPRECDVTDTAAGPVFYYRGARIVDAVVRHIPWIVQPGKTKGFSPIGGFRAMIDTGAAAQDLARSWNSGGGVPLGHLKSSGQGANDPKLIAAGKERFREAVRGRDLFVSGDDWTFSPFSLNPADLQFVETMKLTATQVATIYGIPPEKIGGERGSSLTYSTVLMDQLDTQVQVLGPWCVRAQQCLSALLPAPQIVRANLDAVLRADPLQRAQVQGLELANGTTTQTEARATVDKPPLTDQERADWLEAYRKGATAAPAATGQDAAGGTQP